MRSATMPGTAADHLEMTLFSPDLSQVALTSYTALNEGEAKELPITLQVGVVGGPYATLATVPDNGQTSFEGANAGTASVPAFSDVLFTSTDHALLPAGPERTAAEDAVEGASDLYDWTGGHLQLVNVEGEGSQVKLVNRCAARLGGPNGQGPNQINAVSADGSKIIFETEQSGGNCERPSRLYMRLDGTDTVEVSAPNEGVSLAEPERYSVKYAGATPDGSKVFFTTETALTVGAPKSTQQKLYQYDTEAPEGQRLTLIASGISVFSGDTRTFLLSEDGSTVYYSKEPGTHLPL